MKRGIQKKMVVNEPINNNQIMHLNKKNLSSSNKPKVILIPLRKDRIKRFKQQDPD